MSTVSINKQLKIWHDEFLSKIKGLLTDDLTFDAPVHSVNFFGDYFEEGALKVMLIGRKEDLLVQELVSLKDSTDSERQQKILSIEANRCLRGCERYWSEYERYWKEYWSSEFYPNILNRIQAVTIKGQRQLIANAMCFWVGNEILKQYDSAEFSDYRLREIKKATEELISYEYPVDIFTVSNVLREKQVVDMESYWNFIWSVSRCHNEKTLGNTSKDFAWIDLSWLDLSTDLVEEKIIIKISEAHFSLLEREIQLLEPDVLIFANSNQSFWKSFSDYFNLMEMKLQNSDVRKLSSSKFPLMSNAFVIAHPQEDGETKERIGKFISDIITELKTTCIRNT